MDNMDNNVQIKLVTDFESFDDLRSAWDILIEKSPSQDVFLSWEWFYAWFKSYGKNSSPYLVTAWDDKELVGLAPFMLIKQKKYGIVFRVLRTLSAPQCDAGGFLVKDGNLKILSMLIEHLVSQKGKWDLIELNQFYQMSLETQHILENMTAKGFAIHQSLNKHFFIPYEAGWDNYHASLSQRFRKNLRRSQRGMDGMGEHKIQRFTGGEVTWDVIEKIIEINRYSTYPLICDSEEDQAMHKELITVMANKGWFDVYMLTLDNKPIAYEYGFLYKGRMGDWRVGFDRRASPNVSIGVFLSMCVFKTGFDERQKEVDFLRGDEGYKNDWKPDFRIYVNIKAARKKKLLTTLAFIWLPKIKFKIQNWLGQDDKR